MPLVICADMLTSTFFDSAWGAMQALTRLNAPKVHTEWRQRMRNAKLAELQAEAERMQARHAHAMHIRNVALQVSNPLLVPPSMLLSYTMSKACTYGIQCILGLSQ